MYGQITGFQQLLAQLVTGREDGLAHRMQEEDLAGLAQGALRNRVEKAQALDDIAEKIDAQGRYQKNANICSFLGLLPAEQPEIGIIVVLDSAVCPETKLRSAGFTAAPVFARVAEPIAHYLDIRPRDAEEPVNYEPVLAGVP